ncbi:hypothetical protein TREMEDRAFT_32321 [Tremella mesenterica DSM 1558]|uniref:uncharacterized protein n=1 Tax=Tremella mesenterica (strain ATCC 24925 / CBS 8224 / DSM 1558 / NBRC 9311 / NRRL Y-6157 / RJB 2259-6 / UBC 559-6) TaxID=578456 RepID=UPI0003F4A188|nr:uncharacterized protein TREMEDRAFT_32321 [Tremella mesenterica DSM 1558]EIW68455.1 hypothetical protein TREMEDRAFT_32321 [Tremella mesenterica DSM 1558]
MRMPAMSPTMTEGGIAGWKLNEGDKFSAGDVLLEIETDKATIDVEAQDDGILGKILVKSGTSKIPVGQVIAVLAEEGDDLASIEIPTDLAPEDPEKSGGLPTAEPPKEKRTETKGSEQKEVKKEDVSEKVEKVEIKKVKSSRPLFPGVARLLEETSLTTAQIDKIQGTGRGGMITKGDVLVALGKINNPYGSAEKLITDVMGPSGKRASEVSRFAHLILKEVPRDAAGIRRLIVAGMAKASQLRPSLKLTHSVTSLSPSSDAAFDAILSPYTSLLPPAQPDVPFPSNSDLVSMESRRSAVIDEYAGLF